MELGPRDRLSQAFWHEKHKGRTIETPHGDVVHLDLRHLGAPKMHERLPHDLASWPKSTPGIDPAHSPIPVRPAVHYTMGGIPADATPHRRCPGLYAAGECSSVGIHGANRLGSNSLTELLVFGKVAGEQAARSPSRPAAQRRAPRTQARGRRRARGLSGARKTRALRAAAAGDARTMEIGVGIYRSAMRCRPPATLASCATATARCSLTTAPRVQHRVAARDRARLQLEVAEAMAHSALNRKESRGSHQRLDRFGARRRHYLKHTLATYRGDDAPGIDYADVTITRVALRHARGADGREPRHARRRSRSR